MVILFGLRTFSIIHDGGTFYDVIIWVLSFQEDYIYCGFSKLRAKTK